MPTYPGDPLTPGIGATKDAKRLPREKAETITKIPVLPIAYEDAIPLLEALGGPVAPETFRGALPLTYHLGPGPTVVHLAVQFNWQLTPAYDVIARLPGGELSDEWVIRGNHHDAWVFGASDPLSGLVPLMEEARAVAGLVKNGWKPRRSIVYTVWDGEEPMLLGSTEWAEDHAAELGRHAVAYINSDGNGRGTVSIGGSHTLEHFANEATRDVIDPEHKVSALDRYRAARIVKGTDAEKKAAREKRDFSLEALGSGSDFTPFLQHLGIATLDIAFGGEDQSDGSYHSIYDSYDHYTKFDDPDFQYAMALAQLGGRVTMRLAAAETLPVRFAGFVRAVEGYLDELLKLTDKMRTDTEDRNRSLSDRSFELASDPRVPYVAPAPKTPVPYLNFAPLQNALARLRTSADAFEDRERRVTQGLDQLQGWVSGKIAEGARNFVAAGGDGTMNLALNALLNAPGRAGIASPEELRFGAVGLGSSNDFQKPYVSDGRVEAGGIHCRLDFDRATAHDIGCMQAEEACRFFIDQRQRRGDRRGQLEFQRGARDARMAQAPLGGWRDHRHRAQDFHGLQKFRGEDRRGGRRAESARADQSRCRQERPFFGPDAL